MSTEGGKPTSFWTTAPGILTAVGTVITAVTGLLIAVDQTGLLTSTKSEAATASVRLTSDAPSSEAAAPSDGAALVGVWSGTVAPASAGKSFTVRLDVRAPCVRKQPCGTIFVGSLPCSGRATLWAIHARTYEFYVDHFSSASAKACSPGAGDFFTLRDDGTLRYTTGYDDTRGVLVSADPSR